MSYVTRLRNDEHVLIGSGINAVLIRTLQENGKIKLVIDAPAEMPIMRNHEIVALLARHGFVSNGNGRWNGVPMHEALKTCASRETVLRT